MTSINEYPYWIMYFRRKDKSKQKLIVKYPKSSERKRKITHSSWMYFAMELQSNIFSWVKISYKHMKFLDYQIPRFNIREVANLSLVQI